MEYEIFVKYHEGKFLIALAYPATNQVIMMDGPYDAMTAFTMAFRQTNLTYTEAMELIFEAFGSDETIRRVP